MAGLGIAIAWVGYATLYYGVTQIQGGNWGFLDLILPSRWAGAAATPRDDGSTPGTGASGGTPQANPPTAPLTSRPAVTVNSAGVASETTGEKAA